MKRLSLLPLLAVWFGIPAVLPATQRKPTASLPAVQRTAADIDFFERKVRPVFVQHCAACHSAKKSRGGLRLDSRAAALKGGETGPAVVPGQPAKSLLLEAVRYTKDDLQMPPKGKLPDNVIADLTTWVQRGAAWPDAPAPGEPGIRPAGSGITAADKGFWSFRPIVDPKLPVVRDDHWPRRPLDHFILAGLESKELRPVKPAERRALIRRVTFDLIGLPPTPEEVEAFVSDSRDDAWERVVNRLLSSPAYGERWGRHWLDVARYGEDQAHTFQARLYPHGWRYRDWVVKAFNDDMPYDRFVTAQIAADLTEGGSYEDLPALGFFALGPVYYADAGEKKRAEAAELDDRVDTLCRGFLGLTVACARCHDHKFDPISTQDYYSLAGIIRSSQYQLAPLASADEVKRYNAAQDRIKAQEARVKDFLEKQAVVLAEGKSNETARYVVAAWKLTTRRNKDPRLTSQTVAQQERLQAATLERWFRYLFRKGADKRSVLAKWHKALAGFDATRDLSRDPRAVAAVINAAKVFQADLQEILKEQQALTAMGKRLNKDKADLLRELFSPKGVFQIDLRKVEAKLAAGPRKQLQDLRAEVNNLRKSAPPTPPLAHAITEGKQGDMPVYISGNPHREGPLVPRHFFRVLAGEEPPLFRKGSGRLELAKAIASRDNPLTARVMVNRIWQHHFGKGLVGSPSNFGMLGERPSHPELLDHLAARFIASGWSIKALHREILLSATYQLGCFHDERNAATDAGNRFYWRMDRRRLDVESLRDALLAVTGTLDQNLGGPASDLNNAGNRRRTLYGAVSRHNLSGLLRLFDFPDANLTSEKRPVTIVPLQQLFVLNSDFMIERARALTRSLQAEAKDDAARIRLAISRLYGRPARTEEVALGLEFLTAPDDPTTGTKASLSRWEQYAQVLLATNEFTFLD